MEAGDNDDKDNNGTADDYNGKNNNGNNIDDDNDNDASCFNDDYQDYPPWSVIAGELQILFVECPQLDFEDDDNENAGGGFVSNADNHDDIANLIIRLASAG